MKNPYFCSMRAKREKKKHAYERRTGWKVVFVNIFIILSCCAILYYMYGLRNSINNQKINIDRQNRALALTKELTRAVHQAQSDANLFAFSDNPQYLKNFKAHTELIHAISDSLIQNGKNDITSEQLNDIQKLIERKGQISYVLSRQFYYFNPLAEIDNTLNEYTPSLPPPPIYINTTTRDTIIHKPKEKKGFWERLGNVFYPDEQDSIIHISTHHSDTIFSDSQDATQDIFEDLRMLSEKAKSEYKAHIKEYEAKTNELIRDDNKLSEQISNILMCLNQQILESTIKEIENSELIIEQNTKISFLIGGAVMVLIIVFVILILSDMSKGYRARRDAEEAQKRTEEIMESRHKLLLSVSHDIKTPLTSIIGNVELMQNEANQKEVDSIQQSADHILNLLTNLLDFSSLEQGKLNVDKSLFNINKLCSETAAMFEPVAHKKNLCFSYSTSVKDNLAAISDRLKIKQIVSNLISNSIKYTLEGEVRFEVKFENSHLVFHITDTGVGIPEDKINDIFTPFVRIDTYSTLAEGNGYGLSVVKGLVELLEGNINVESEAGKGTHFTVRIPIEYELEAVEKPAPTEQNISKRILIIDDDDALLSVTHNMLHRLGHQSFACRSMADIETALNELNQYDSILTDREMGALTGNDILKLFKEKDPEKAVLLMTARTEYNQNIAREEGFDGFLKKPFNLNDLEQLFGQGSITEDANEIQEETEDFSLDFPIFSEMLGHDSEAIKGILKVFVASTTDDMMVLNGLIDTDDCIAAQALCHKMLPMFKQLERDTTFLTKMNDMRGVKDSYPTWKEDANVFLQQADALLELLAGKYGIE